MNALIVYDSQFGNTERIAQAIADALREAGPVRAVRASEANPGALAGVDLLVVGSPTQAWRPMPSVRSFLESLGSLGGLAVAAFDTRLGGPSLLTGSAARAIAKVLSGKGASLLVPPESFIVTGREGPLKEGELGRAAAWARQIQERQAAVSTRTGSRTA